MVGVKQALFIAAGNGSRLQPASGQIPKPLTPVCGVPLLKRLLHQAYRAGIEECVIVIGYEGQALRRSVESDASFAPLPIKWVMNEHWQQANGLSVLAAKEHLKSDFVLLMADHLFQSQTLARLLRRRPTTGEVILGVDRKIDHIYDIDDATKVKVNGTQILAIGKDLKEFNAVDTGMFLCSPAIFEALETSRKKGDSSLSGGMKELISQEKLRYLDIRNGWWLDVDTPAALRQAERNLFNQLRHAEDGLFDRHVHRALSMKLTRTLLKKPVSSEMLRAIGLLLGCLSALCLAHASYVSVFLGAIFFEGLMVLNFSAEELARLRLEEPIPERGLGSWTQRLIYFIFLLGVILGYHREAGQGFVLLLGAITIFDGALMMLFVDKGSSHPNLALETSWSQILELNEGSQAQAPATGHRNSTVEGHSVALEHILDFGRIFLRPYRLAPWILAFAVMGKLSWIFWFIFFGTHLAALRLFYQPRRWVVDRQAKLAP